MSETTSLNPFDIAVGEGRLRSVNAEAVQRLKESIVKIGLRVPISVRFISDEDGFQLVAGLHRLVAVKELGLAEIPIREETGDELDAKLWEIAENLHRAELTSLERSEHIAEWIRIAEQRELKLAQVAPVYDRLTDVRDNVRPGGRGKTGGINAATRELGIERTQAQRAAKVDALAPEAKEEAKILRLDDNQSALVRAARETTKEQQLRSLREHAARRADSKSEVTASERRIESAVSAVKKLSQEELLVFVDWFDPYRGHHGGAVFDNTAVGSR